MNISIKIFSTYTCVKRILFSFAFLVSLPYIGAAQGQQEHPPLTQDSSYFEPVWELKARYYRLQSEIDSIVEVFIGILDTTSLKSGIARQAGYVLGEIGTARAYDYLLPRMHHEIMDLGNIYTPMTTEWPYYHAMAALGKTSERNWLLVERLVLFCSQELTEEQLKFSAMIVKNVLRSKRGIAVTLGVMENSATYLGLGSDKWPQLMDNLEKINALIAKSGEYRY